jgi:3-hydroxyacyl-CoA dehydrogenase
MNSQKCFELQDCVAVVMIDNPPVNALTTGVPEGIARSVEAANCDANVRSVVIIGAGKTFAAGADINEFVRFVAGQGPMPELHRWFNASENSAKPVVMAIHGHALGAGLELAMAGHYRVASPDARIGQPEVKIGLIPGAAGTVRLPRLAGIEKAAEMIAFGEPISAQDALACGIIDRIIEGDLLTGAIAFANEVAGPRRTRDLPVRGDIAALTKLRERLPLGREAPIAALEAIAKTAGVSFEEGCAAEAEIFMRCIRSRESHELIEKFFAERAARKRDLK